MAIVQTSNPRTRLLVALLMLVAVGALVGYVRWYKARAVPTGSADASGAGAPMTTADPPMQPTALRAEPSAEWETSAAAPAGSAIPSMGASAMTPIDLTQPAPADTGDANPPLSDVSPHDAAFAPPGRSDPVAELTRRAVGTPPTTPEPDDVLRARRALVSGDLVTARRILNDAARRHADPIRSTILGELARLADATIFCPALLTDDPLVAMHVVGRGETLLSIARRFHITDNLLAEINDLPSKNRISIGQTLKVIRGPLHGAIEKKAFRLDVLLDGVIVRSFPVGLGENNKTPTGRWLIRDKLANPAWTHPYTHEHYNADDPDNPIGEYWLGLEGIDGAAVGKRGFGIHGTIDPSSIGREMSLGCIRLAPADIEQVYWMFVSGESTVEVRD